MSKISSGSKDSVDSDCPSGCSMSSSSISYEHKVRVPTNPKEELFLRRALHFLTSIETQTQRPSSSSSSEELSEEENEELRRNIDRNDKSVSSSSLSDRLSRRSSTLSIKENPITQWISTKGNLVKSYRHYLHNSLNEQLNLQLNIDLTDAPPCLKPGPFKDAMNEEFAHNHPELPHNLTLSKIVNLREDLILKLCKPLDIEACTMTMASTSPKRLMSL